MFKANVIAPSSFVAKVAKNHVIDHPVSLINTHDFLLFYNKIEEMFIILTAILITTASAHPNVYNVNTTINGFDCAATHQ